MLLAAPPIRSSDDSSVGGTPPQPPSPPRTEARTGSGGRAPAAAGMNTLGEPSRNMSSEVDILSLDGGRRASFPSSDMTGRQTRSVSGELGSKVGVLCPVSSMHAVL